MPISAAVAVPAHSSLSLCGCLRHSTRRQASRGSRYEDDEELVDSYTEHLPYRVLLLQVTADVSACAGFDVTLSPSSAIS